MRSVSKRVGAAMALAASACIVTGATSAHAVNQCSPAGQYPTFNVGQRPNVSYIVGNNGWGLQAGEQLCIDVQSNGDFSVTSNSVMRNDISSYPNILKGQSYSEGTDASGFPIQVSAVNSLPVTWNISGTNASGIWDAAIELWANTTNTDNVQQADGTELMIWLNASNTTPGGLTPIGQMATGGVLWDVRAARWPPPDPNRTQYWNYVAYFPANGNVQNSISTDVMPFVVDTEYRTGGAYGGCKIGPSGGPGQCLYPNWYFTSIQAGFEMAKGGTNLASSNFKATVNGTVPAPLYGQTAVSRDANGNLVVFYPEYNGVLNYDVLCYYGNCQPGTWSGETPLGNTLAKQVVAQKEVSGVNDVFYNDPSSLAIKFNVECPSCASGWQGEKSFGSSGKQLTALQYPWTGAIQVFFSDQSNVLKYRTQCWGGTGCGTATNGVEGWTAEQIVGTAKAQQIAATADNNGNVFVFYTDPTSSALKYNEECPSCSNTWVGEKTVGSATAKQIAVGLEFQSGSVVVFYTDPSTGAVSYNASCSTCTGGWRGAQTLPGANAKQLSMFYNGDGRLELVYVGTDNLIHQYIQTTVGDPMSWTAWQIIVAPFRDLELAMAPDGKLVFFGAAIDGSLEFSMQDPNRDDPPAVVPFSAMMSAPGPYSGLAYVGSP